MTLAGLGKLPQETSKLLDDDAPCQHHGALCSSGQEGPPLPITSSDADGDGFNDNVDGDPTNALAVGSDANGANFSNVTLVTFEDADADGAPDLW